MLNYLGGFEEGFCRAISSLCLTIDTSKDELRQLQKEQVAAVVAKLLPAGRNSVV